MDTILKNELFKEFNFTPGVEQQVSAIADQLNAINPLTAGDITSLIELGQALTRSMALEAWLKKAHEANDIGLYMKLSASLDKLMGTKRGIMRDLKSTRAAGALSSESKVTAKKKQSSGKNWEGTM